MLYSEKVMDHFQNPRNVGKMDDADGVGEVGNAVCGDIMKMYIKVKGGLLRRQGRHRPYGRRSGRGGQREMRRYNENVFEN